MKRTIVVALLVGVAGCRSASSDEPASEPPAPSPAEPTAQPPARDAPAAKPRRELVREQPLPEIARKVLRTKMMRHGEDMESLLWSALMLDYGTIEFLTDDISREPLIARPGPGAEGTINQALPAAFFELQDDMRAATERLHAAAVARDDRTLADAYGDLAKTCIACHSVYLNIPPAPAQ